MVYKESHYTQDSIKSQIVLQNESAVGLATEVTTEAVFETVNSDQRLRLQFTNTAEMAGSGGVLKPLFLIINEWDKNSMESQLFRVSCGASPKYVEIKLQELIFNFRNCVVVTLTDVSELIELIKAQSRQRLENMLTLNISRQMMSPIQSIVQMATNSHKLGRVDSLKANMELIVYTAQIVYF